MRVAKTLLFRKGRGELRRRFAKRYYRQEQCGSSATRTKRDARSAQFGITTRRGRDVYELKKRGIREFSTEETSATFVSRHYELGTNDVVDYLERKGYTFRSHGNGQINSKECPFCKPHKGRPDNLWKLYLRQKDGAYFCHRCGSKGSWYDFKRHHGDLTAVAETSKPSGATPNGAGRATSKTAAPLPKQEDPVRFSKELLKDNKFPKTLRYLTEIRGLSEETLAKYGIGASNVRFRSDENEGEWIDRECVVFPWIVRKNDEWVTIRTKIRALEEKHRQKLSPAGGDWGFFGWHTVPDTAKEIIVTEGEYDAMAVHQATGLPAISLPNGCRSLPVQLLPSMERFERIILWCDADEPGQEGAQQFSQKLGRKRCLIVPPAKSIPPRATGGMQPPKDANEALLRDFDLQTLIDDAEPLRHQEIITFSDIREDVRREVLSPPHVSGPHFKSLPAFQDLMKGFRRGELSVYTGPTGSGKTTLLSQLSLDLCDQGINTLWGSFEIKNERIIKKMLCQHARVDLSEGLEEIQSMTEDEAIREAMRRQQRFHAAAEDFDQLPMYFMRFFGSTKVDQVIDAMDYAAYAYDVQHVILDNLQFMLSGQGSASSFDRFSSQETAIEKFRAFATNRNVHVSLVMHPRKEPDDQKLGLSSIFGSAKATQEADNVVILQKIEPEGSSPTASSAATQKFLEVRKNRYDGELGSVRLLFNSGAQLFYEADKRASAKRKGPSRSREKVPESPVAEVPAARSDETPDEGEILMF